MEFSQANETKWTSLIAFLYKLLEIGGVYQIFINFLSFTIV